MNFEINPKLDLVLERVVDVPRDLVWKAWTEPEHLVKWFCPRPWSVPRCEVELYPGGAFNFVMKGPDTPEMDNKGCIIEAVDGERLVWTSCMTRGFRPVHDPTNPPEIVFTGKILLEDCDGGTKYTAICIHPDAATCKRHDEMGFQEGWGTCLDQLVDEIKKGNIS